MSRENFLEIATLPGAWYRKSDELQTAADLIWDNFAERFLENEDLAAIGLLPSALMLYGFSLEAAMKGRLLEIQPDKVRIDMQADGEGEIHTLSIKEFGVLNHDLERLAELVGLLPKDEEDETRFLLRQLTACIRWAGRYPIPKRLQPGDTTASTLPFGRGHQYMKEAIATMLSSLRESRRRDLESEGDAAV